MNDSSSFFNAYQFKGCLSLQVGPKPSSPLILVDGPKPRSPLILVDGPKPRSV
jgi:hypothetical protein